MTQIKQIFAYQFICVYPFDSRYQRSMFLCAACHHAIHILYSFWKPVVSSG